MKLSDALTKYRGYRKELVEQKRTAYLNLKNAEEKARITGDSEWAKQAASLQLSYEKTDKLFEDNQKILDGLMDQYTAAWNMEVARAEADPETGVAATLGKIMTTVARMCAGDKVPASDEKKVMEYDSDMYAKAKQAQMIMASMKERQKEYDSLWDDEEGGEYDREKAADNTEAAGDLPDINISEPLELLDISAAEAGVLVL